MSEGSQNPFHDVTIHQNEWGEVRSIELDGFDVKGLVDFRINSPMREIPTLQITLRINELEVGDYE